jgi:hypothetical protein
MRRWPNTSASRRASYPHTSQCLNAAQLCAAHNNQTKENDNELQHTTNGVRTIYLIRINAGGTQHLIVDRSA